ncbi:MAG: NUDIX hydrolase [Actinomycetota bacterium]|nr:NUDIX hydrolase [Actinomycetota bacterium]
MEPAESREVFRGTLIRVEVESWPAGEREVVRHPGACGIVAMTADGEVLLVRQTREAIRADILEIPAGVLDVPGEQAAACAARELEEETGYAASDVRPLAMIHTSPGFTDEVIHLFTARASPAAGRTPEHGIEVVPMPLGEAVGAVRDGRITDAKTAVALLLTAERRGQ